MIASHIYHVYNRGINKQKIFFNDDNYRYFLRKLRRYIRPRCDLLGYCLMPNHFHVLLRINDESLVVEEREYPRLYAFHRATALSEGFRTLLSSYTQGVNRQQARCGSLFQQNTRFKATGDGDIESYAFWCLHYIHMNPVRAGLVSHPARWKWSSYNEYFEPVDAPICNVDRGRECLHLDINDLRMPIV